MKENEKPPITIPSELKVIASETLDISSDLNLESNKTIVELIEKDEKKDETESEKK